MKQSLIFLFTALAFSLAGKAQHTERIVDGSATIGYPPADPSKPPVQTVSFDLTVSYSGTATGPVPVAFVTANGTSAALGETVISAPVNIQAADFAATPKTHTYRVFVTLNALPSLAVTEMFDIMLAGHTGAGDGRFRVMVRPVANNLMGSAPVIRQLINNDTLSPLVADHTSSAIRNHWLKYEVVGVSDTALHIPIAISSNSGNSITATSTLTTITVPASATVSGYYRDSVLMPVQINSQTSFDEDEAMYISINGLQRDELIFSRSKLNRPNKPFWVEVGSNFDFVDGLQANNFFSGVFFHRRDILPVHGKFNTSRNSRSSWKNLGVFAGAYESKTISAVGENEPFYRRYYDAAVAPVDTLGRVGLFGDSSQAKTVQVVRNISLFWSPQLRLTSRSANMDGLHLFLSFWTEMQWQKVTQEQEFSSVKRADTTFVAKDQVDFYVTAKSRTDIDIKTHYVGFGLPVYFREDDVNLFVNTVIGASNQPKNDELQPYFDGTKQGIPSRVWRPFYLWQFRLSEERYGISFTGEIRGLIVHNSPPLVSLALSKKFDLKKFLEFK